MNFDWSSYLIIGRRVFYHLCQNLLLYNSNLVAIFSIVVLSGDTTTNATAQNTANAHSPSTDKVQVSIVPGESTLTDDAYSPNLREVPVDQTVVWTNDDTAFDPVTSGLIGAADAGKEFDSGLADPTALIIKVKTLEHKLVTGGEYPAFHLQQQFLIH